MYLSLFYNISGKSQTFKVCSSVKAQSSAFFTVEYKQLLIMEVKVIEHRIPIEFGRDADYVEVLVSF